MHVCSSQEDNDEDFDMEDAERRANERMQAGDGGWLLHAHGPCLMRACAKPFHVDFWDVVL